MPLIARTADARYWEGKYRGEAKENKTLRAALKECADDLESELNDRYPTEGREHPVMARKYERDMKPVMRARQLLG